MIPPECCQQLLPEPPKIAGEEKNDTDKQVTRGRKDTKDCWTEVAQS